MFGHEGPVEEVRNEGEVNDGVTNGHPDPVLGLGDGREYAVGQVLQSEVGSLGNLYPRHGAVV